MPKPKTKTELEQQCQQNFEKLLQLIDGFSREEREQSFPEGTMNRNIRDVIGHLHHWHLMFLDWYVVGMNKEQPDMPAKGFTWKMTPILNRQIWEKCQTVSFLNMLEQVKTSHGKVHQIIVKHSNEELFEKKKYKWTGSTSLGAYLISNTSSHYTWAYKLIKKGLK